MTKSQTAKRQLEQMMKENKKMKKISSASLAANPMLAAVYCPQEDLCFEYFFRFRFTSVNQ
jgi:RNase H-fold protein (predicted Holliday junction resolvase)